MSKLPNFPQHGQPEQILFDVPEDAPEMLKIWLPRLRFTKNAVRWFNLLKPAIEDADDDLIPPVQSPASAGIAPQTVTPVRHGFDPAEMAIIAAQYAPTNSRQEFVQAVAADVANKLLAEIQVIIPLPQRHGVPEAFGTMWNGKPDAPTKSDAYAKIIAMISAAAYGAGWAGITDIAPSQSAIYNLVRLGTYTPALTNVANLDGSTANPCQWLRLDNTVVVSGLVSVDPTAGGVSTQLGIALPVASNLGNSYECAGTAFSPTIAGQGAAILGDVANNRAQMEWIAGDVTNQPMYFTFMYQVI